jgi:AFG1-like ATPase
MCIQSSDPQVALPSRHPDDLYKNGIQRTSFLPAIDLLKSKFDITDLDSGTGLCPVPLCNSNLTSLYDAQDYRRIPRALSHAYFSPLNSTTRAAINAQFTALTEGIPVRVGKTIRLWGRDLTVPRCAGHVAQFTFAELCGRPLGAADYLELTQRFGTLFVTDVPRMGLGEKDKVRQGSHRNVFFCYSYRALRSRRGVSLLSSTHAITARRDCSFHPKCPSLKSFWMIRVSPRDYLYLITCAPSWMS